MLIMTEKEKQQSGELFDPKDRELTADRINAKKLGDEYSAIIYNDFQKRERLLDRFVAMKGENVVIEPGFNCDYGYNIVIGDNFFADRNCMIADSGEVIFGDNIFIGPNCTFLTTYRPCDPETRNKGLMTAKTIKIGSNVDIGANVTILGGVTIGDNVVITAGKVISEDVPANSVV